MSIYYVNNIMSTLYSNSPSRLPIPAQDARCWRNFTTRSPYVEDRKVFPCRCRSDRFVKPFLSKILFSLLLPWILRAVIRRSASPALLPSSAALLLLRHDDRHHGTKKAADQMPWPATQCKGALFRCRQSDRPKQRSRYRHIQYASYKTPVLPFCHKSAS